MMQETWKGVVDTVTCGARGKTFLVREVMIGHDPTHLSAGRLSCNLDDVSSSTGPLAG